MTHPKNIWTPEVIFQGAKRAVIFVWGVKATHDVSRLLGRRLGALLSVDAYKVRQGGTAGEQRSGITAKEGQQHLFKQQRNGDAFDTADRGVRQLQRK